MIHSPGIETHLKHIRILFQRLRKADLKLKNSKCNYFKTHVQYLGHLVSGNGIKPLPEKLESVKKMPAPTTPKEIKVSESFFSKIGPKCGVKSSQNLKIEVRMPRYIIQPKIRTSEYQCGYWYGSFGRTLTLIYANYIGGLMSA